MWRDAQVKSRLSRCRVPFIFASDRARIRITSRSSNPDTDKTSGLNIDMTIACAKHFQFLYKCWIVIPLERG